MRCCGLLNTVLSLSKDGRRAPMVAAWFDKLTTAGQTTSDSTVDKVANSASRTKQCREAERNSKSERERRR